MSHIETAECIKTIKEMIADAYKASPSEYLQYIVEDDNEFFSVFPNKYSVLSPDKDGDLVFNIGANHCELVYTDVYFWLTVAKEFSLKCINNRKDACCDISDGIIVLHSHIERKFLIEAVQIAINSDPLKASTSIVEKETIEPLALDYTIVETWML